MPTKIKATPTPETDEFMLEYGKAVAAGTTRQSIWEKMLDLECRLIAMRNAAQWGIDIGQVVGNSKVVLKEALANTAPKQSRKEESKIECTTYQKRKP